MDLHAHIRAFVGELVVEHYVDLACPMEREKLSVETFSLGAGRNVVKEILSNHLLWDAARDHAFGTIVFYDLTVPIEHDGTEWQVLRALRLARQNIIEVLAAERNYFHRSILVLDGRDQSFI